MVSTRISEERHHSAATQDALLLCSSCKVIQRNNLFTEESGGKFYAFQGAFQSFHKYL